MNPYPFWPLNHFTVPFVMQLFFQIRVYCGRASTQPVCSRFGGKSFSPTPDARRGQVSGPSSMAAIWGTTVWTARLTAIPGEDDHSEKASSWDVTPRSLQSNLPGVAPRTRRRHPCQTCREPDRQRIGIVAL
jgi:hypothetical protein